MSAKAISYIVGYFIGINIFSLILIYVKAKTDLIEMENKKFNIVCVILSALGGFVGILLGAEMGDYEQDNKLFKRWIPFMVFIEFCIAIYIIYKNVY